ncbi:PIG-L family deacetylase [Streptomyces sp. IBSBF 2953]|uniref:PIG-L family deacetylase n=1 Tax=Streptomyces hayashii TaxID=2839966 RepID=UPI002119BCD4|nr:PIG-L family deacetylase [Streptomyces hayashii]
MPERPSPTPLVRRTTHKLLSDDRPIRLPHTEFDGAGVRFLGEPVDSALFPSSATALWHACDGTRPYRSWPSQERELIAGWHTAGLVVAAPPPRLQPSRGLTVLSPHPDDAQLALGALLARFGGRVVDVFSHETWTRRPHYRSRPALASRLLLAEEHVACRVLGAELTVLGHTDAADRPAWRDGYFLGPQSVDTARATEPDLFERVAADLVAEVAGGGPVLVPLAVGGHVDHVLTRQAALHLIAQRTLEPERVAFYEDMPYSLFADATAEACRLAVGPEHVAPVPVLIPASEAAVRTKQEALWPYRLQVLEAVSKRIVRHGRQLGAPAWAERLWVLPESAGMFDELAAAAAEEAAAAG